MSTLHRYSICFSCVDDAYEYAEGYKHYQIVKAFTAEDALTQIKAGIPGLSVVRHIEPLSDEDAPSS